MAGLSAIPIVALDTSNADAALRIVERLGDRCDFYKVGSELFTAAGPDMVRALRDHGARVFLDLKFHDIPNTVRGAVRSARGLGASLVTVHASGGVEMMSAAVEAAEGAVDVLAVSVLTSHDAVSLGEAWGREALGVREEVLRLAELAVRAGVPGMVCSGHEAASVRARLGSALALLVPGIRLAGEAAHDQRRVMTPAAAASAGATWVVLGRAVTAAPDPVEAMEQVLGELGG
ncbi:MAG TPA: orotidine-5'-phosphate decarboxylase [Gemmatimonadaceae bacterium]|nr:orotidine-5'-phosphate decarboxylase [Gemmatimonadaceae bacterium]